MQGQNKNYIVIVGGVVVGLLVAGAAYKITKPVLIKTCRSLLQDGEEMGNVGPSKNVVIEAVRTKIGTISRRIVTVGKLEANQSVMIRSEMPGKIKEIPFKEGEDIKEGDVLFQFEDSDLVAELNQAQAEVDLYDASFSRVSQLQAARIESLKNLDEARARRDGARAKVEMAQAKLNKARILAPFSGSVGLTQFSPGAFVQAAQDLVMLVDNNVLLVDFKIPESYLNDIGVGQVAEIRLDGYPDKVFRALVEAVDSFIDPLSHSIACRGSLPNFERSLRSGLFANVSLIIGEKTNALLVPESALQREGEIEFVWVVQDGKADRRRVVTSTRENAQMEIIAGLRPDEIVVTSGQIKLYPGARVHIGNMPELYGAETGDLKTVDSASSSLSAGSKVGLDDSQSAKKEEPIDKDKNLSFWSRLTSKFSSRSSGADEQKVVKVEAKPVELSVTEALTSSAPPAVAVSSTEKPVESSTEGGKDQPTSEPSPQSDPLVAPEPQAGPELAEQDVGDGGDATTSDPEPAGPNLDQSTEGSAQEIGEDSPPPLAEGTEQNIDSDQLDDNQTLDQSGDTAAEQKM